MSLYSKRGVSAQKEEVHAAVQKLDQGLFPHAFCKIYPDYLGGDDNYINVMHADGAGTKSILAYLYWKETGDISVWKGIAQDAIVMNLDDLLCVGIYDNIVFNSTIDRNKHLIPGEVLQAIINGSQKLFDTLKSFGVNIHYLGGETADVGDVVRSVAVNGTMTCRWPKDKIITNEKIKANDVKPSTNTEFNSGGLSGQDAINAELKYRASEEGKAEMARKKAEKEAKKEANKEGKSMLDSMGMTFPSPFTPAKTTPSKSTAVIVRPQQQSMFDFVLGGGTPSKQYTKPTEEDVKKGAKIKRVKELNSKPDKTTKETLQYNDLRQELAGTPNENPVIASNAIKNAFKGKLARNEMKINSSMRQSELNAATSIQKAVRGHKARKQIADEANQLEKQIKGVEKTVKKATTRTKK